MKRRLFIFAILIILLGSNTLRLELVRGNQESLKFIINNFERVYTEDYELFWSVFHDVQSRVLNCCPIEDTVLFLSVAKIKKGNAEFNEYFSKILEKSFLTNKKKCFFDAFLKLDRESQMAIIHDLHNPIYIEKTYVDEILNRLRNDHKYKLIFELYIQFNENTQK